MIETMERSTDAILGYRMSGDVTKADYQTLVTAVAAAIDAKGSVSLLFDLTDFHREKASAWAATSMADRSSRQAHAAGLQFDNERMMSWL